MSTINREAAIRNLTAIISKQEGKPLIHWEQVKKMLEAMPEAQPTQSNDSNTLNALDQDGSRLGQDLISRQAAIDAIEAAKEIYVDRKTILAKTQDIINNLPSAQPEQHWIPCGEKLPEEDVRSYAPYDEHLSAFVLVTLKGQTWPYKKLTVKLARYSYTYNEWKVPNNNLGVVTAWMPLPKPYKAESE